MKRLWLGVALVMCVALLVAQAAQPAAIKSTPGPAKTSSPAKATTPGIHAAETLSMITGVAISPLLGVSAVGAYKYIQAPADQRNNLPWFAQPWFWVPGLLLVAAAFAKDTLGTVVPTALKKPVDVLEAFENKVSGLVATGAFVPMVATFIPVSTGDGASLSQLGFAAVDMSAVYNTLLVPFAMVAFIVVWLVGHAINMLILISPFATVDAALKSFRTFLLSTVAVSSFMDPYIGALWAAIIIIVSYCLAGWSFRLTVFGSCFVWDYLTFARTRFRPQAEGNSMFLARETNKVPIRTYGRVKKNEHGEFVLRYRPWLVLPARELVLPPGHYAVGRGLVYPELICAAGDDTEAVMTLPPRYITHEDELAKLYGIGVQDVGVVKGLKNLWRGIKEVFGFREASVSV
jgi:hypothetical protein